jgi:hypothetical protein
MPDAPAYDQSGETPDTASGQGGAPPGTPRWVKVTAIAALVLVLVLILMMLAGGEHGPGRHLGGGDEPSASQGEGGQHSPPSDAPGGHEPPPWAPEH